jgi:trans-2,3-dihydro-3-hydroxyanthranilate isomerase
MSPTLPFYLVDAFAERPFAGNVAGVVLDADELNDSQMQRIASEIHASETAFLSRGGDLHRPPLVRWFTPAAEVGFCGHATLASAHALHESGRLSDLLSLPGTALVLDSAAGELRLLPETLPEPHKSPMWWLDMPAPTLKPELSNPLRMCEVLGLHEDDLDATLPPMRTRDDDVIYAIKSWQTLMDLQPRFSELADWCRRQNIRGVCVATTATLTEAINVHSRFFAPAFGINEDPVTGSVHGPLAAYLVKSGRVRTIEGRAALFCAQSRAGDRGGLVRALVETTPHGYQVHIGGLCQTTLTGDLLIPPV